jgi:hypothetical protein
MSTNFTTISGLPLPLPPPPPVPVTMAGSASASSGGTLLRRPHSLVGDACGSYTHDDHGPAGTDVPGSRSRVLVPPPAPLPPLASPLSIMGAEADSASAHSARDASVASSAELVARAWKKSLTSSSSWMLRWQQPTMQTLFITHQQAAL